MKRLLLIISLVSTLGIGATDQEFVEDIVSNITDVVSSIESDLSYSNEEKETAFEYVADHLEETINKLQNDENIYSTPAYLGGK